MPKPAHVKAVAGNPGKRPITEPPEPAEGDVSCPAWLSAKARNEWERIAPELQRLGLLTVLDVSSFALYCQSFAAWSACQEIISEKGTTYLTPKGSLRLRPEVELAKTYWNAAKAIGAEFGLSPGSRARLHIETPKVKEDNEFERWLRRGQ
ncbi:MAG TPA: phage terminase small subunit P27 family [Dehalococcoidia bacterium]|nr:phage terminase small subunit P27 family [Dehalococcoidia bacterium]